MERKDDRFPIGLLSATLLFSAAATVGMAWQITHSVQLHKQSREEQVRLSALRGLITHHDEALTMSAKMAAATGDPAWERRYHRFTAPLDEAIHEVKEIFPLAHGSANQTDQANIQLIEMETRAFDLVRSGRKEEAMNLLASAAYETQKMIYTKGMEDLMGFLRLEMDLTIEKDKIRSDAAVALILLILPLLFATWLVVIRTLQKHHKALMLANGELNELNSSLDRTVTARTEQLIQSEKMSAIGQLAAGVAHEINNPLGIILGFVQSLKSKAKNDDTMTTPIFFIEKEALRCKEMVRNLLVFSRSSDLEQHHPVDAAATIDETLSLVAAQSRIKNINLIKDIHFGLPKISGNKIQIQQIVINLCNNAMDAMPDGGELTVRAEPARRDGKPVIVIAIHDTGSGMPNEVQKKIFEPFFTTKEVGKGTGLGLSLVYEMVQKHRGAIEVESRPGKGTTFSVFLPALESEAQRAA